MHAVFIRGFLDKASSVKLPIFTSEIKFGFSDTVRKELKTRQKTFSRSTRKPPAYRQGVSI
jgi:hypothetical protein